nr:four helix bundle protein [uncultured Mucilaginibacter sp.]
MVISQITRAAVSIPSNIAEGCGRKSNKKFHQFLSIALGSSFELETQSLLQKNSIIFPKKNYKYYVLK